MATTAKKEKDGFVIGVSCPGCGGELELDDNFFAIECCHCGSGHRIIMPDSPPAFIADLKITKQQARFEIDRYLKEQGKPLTHSDYQLKRMYYPYWKIDAVLFRVRKGVEKRVIVEDRGREEGISYTKEKSDISLSPYTTTLTAGLKFNSLPASLGLRSEYLKLFTLSDEHIAEDFDLLPVLKPWEEIRKTLNQHIAAIGSYDTNMFGVNKTEIHSPKAMLLYFPFFIFDFYEDDGFNRFVVDGVTGRVLNHITSLKFESTQFQETTEVSLGEISIVPHRCDNCGIDLPTEESLVYICKNCQVITDLEPGVDIDFIRQVTHQGNQQNILMPFWAFTTDGVDRKILKSVFGGIYDSDKVVVPAFRVQNYNALYKLTKRMSAAYPQFEFENITKFGKRYAPVNLPLNQAVSLTELFIKTDKYKKNISNNKLPTYFKFNDVTLFYAPFRLESYFYVDSVLQAVTFEKSLI